MKKLFLTLTALAVAAGLMSATETANYVEQLEGLNTSTATFAPKGWRHSYNPTYYDPATYVQHESGGHSGGYLEVSSQYGSNSYASYYKNYSYNDVLITPKVKGTVTLWVKKLDNTATLNFYNISDGVTAPSSYSFKLWDGSTDAKTGGLASGWDALAVGEWGQVTLTLNDYMHLGIRGHKVGLDEFRAEKADVVYRKSMTIKTTKNFTGNLEADQNNKVTFDYTLTFDNDGDIDFPAGDFTVRLYNSNLEEFIATQTVNAAIPAGSKVDKNISMTVDAKLAPNTKANSFNVYVNRNDLDKELNTNLGYITIIPYAPVAVFSVKETGTETPAAALTVAMGKAGASRQMWLLNSGTAPLQVTGVNVTGDFTCDLTACTVQPSGKKAVNIALKGATGRKEGKLTISMTGLDDIAIDLLGLVKDDTRYFEDFEGEGEDFPVGYIPENTYWKLTGDPEDLRYDGNNRWAFQSQTYESSRSKLITPLIHFDEGEKLSFIATKSDNTSALLSIYTSTDRTNWTLVKEIKANPGWNEPDNGVDCFSSDAALGKTAYGKYEWRLFTLDMPKGDIYVAFEAGAARVDNIYGGKKVDVAHDLLVTDKAYSKKAYVNTRYNASVTVRNISAITEEGYTVNLMVNGEKALEAENKQAIEHNAIATFDFAYTPHFTGDANFEIVFTKGDDSITLLSFSVPIEEERAIQDYKVGEEKITVSDPIDLASPFYQSEIVFTADRLKLNNGAKIRGFKVIGISTKPFEKHFVVYAENTTDAGYDITASTIEPRGFENMTKVFEGDLSGDLIGKYDNTNGHEWAELLEFSFNEPLVYNGGNLRIAFDITDIDENNPSTSWPYIACDNTERVNNDNKDLNYCIFRKHEYVIEEQAWRKYVYGIPVIMLEIQKDIAELNGTVTDEFGEPIEGAEISLSADDNLYSGLTSAEGQYRISVLKPEFTYALSVTADEMQPIEQKDVTFSLEDPLKTLDFTLDYTDRTGVITGTVTGPDKTAVAGASVTVWAEGTEYFTCTTRDDGTFDITIPELSLTYNIKVTADGMETYTGTVKMTSRETNTEISMTEIEDGLTTIGIDLDGTMEIYTLQGVKVNGMTQGNVYIVRQGDKTLKVKK